MTRHSNLRGIAFAIAGFTFWVLADTSIKLVGGTSIPAYEILAFLGLFVTLAVFLYTAARRNLPLLKPHNAGHQVVRSGLDLANNICVVIALRHISLPLFYILVFMAPMVVTLLSAVFLHEKIGVRKTAAVLAGFAGVILAVSPMGASTQRDWIGYAACMVCVACFSVNMVWSRVLTRTESAESLTFVSGLAMAVFGFCAMFWHAEPLAGRWLAVLLAMGIFCAAGSLCFFLALKHTTASNVSQYHYTQLLTGSVVSWLVWRQLPTAAMVFGGLLIVTAGIYIALLGAAHA